jgi:hypothetical protein
MLNYMNYSSITGFPEMLHNDVQSGSVLVLLAQDKQMPIKRLSHEVCKMVSQVGG